MIINKKATFDYEFIKTEIAGIVLFGSEVKSIRAGKANLKDSFCVFQNNELFTSFHISENKESSYNNHNPTRPKKLLLTKEQLNKFKKAIETKGLTIIPYKVFINDNGLIKVEVVLVKGKKLYEKRETIKENDINRDLKQQLNY